MEGLPPIRKVFRIIESCDRHSQLESCKNIAISYSEMANRRGVINSNLIKEILFIKIKEKAHELKLSNQFRGRIRRKKIKIKDPELELAFKFCG